jgi:hypothetical protein
MGQFSSEQTQFARIVSQLASTHFGCGSIVLSYGYGTRKRSRTVDPGEPVIHPGEPVILVRRDVG